jgi:hypothetical protein
MPLVSWRLLIPQWAYRSWDMGNFLLLLFWIYFVYLWLGHFLLLQCLWFTGLVFWWSVLVCLFHSSWVFCPRIILLLHKYLFCLWAQKFCLPLVPVCWSGFLLYFLVALRDILFPGFLFDFFPETFHIFVVLFFSILCFLLFSCTFLFRVSFFDFGVWLNPPWVYLVVFIYSWAFYPCSLDICWIILACFH